jgi:Zn ribbon nucleic-acid-binding protein
MNCPKCKEALHITVWPALYESDRYRCDDCGWQSETLATMVLASPSYRLAQLQAQGAKPGWYGPDGKKCQEEHDEDWNVIWLFWRDSRIGIDEARMCGFVEVKP